jgi:crotonobetainyl-CoA:carnitine CoA-transferase CaiB-like acyl-CoA transferase
MSNLPLARFKVIDLTRARSGPTCVRHLADWGADVVKVEAVLGDAAEDLGGARHGFDFQNLHRNKRSITLDLKQDEGKAILKRLAADADVLVENFRADVKHRLGIDYETLRAINKRLVYGSISGFGQDGPYRDRPGFDQIAQGMGGLMSITGLPGQGPMRVGIPIADLTSGMYCAIGILIALLERETSGEGQWVQTSLLQAQIAMLDFQAARWLIAGEVPKQAGNDHPTSIPTGVFRTKDGHMNIAASGKEMFGRLCRALGAPELLADQRFDTDRGRSLNRNALNAAIEEYTAKRDTAAWIEILNGAGVPCGPIYSIDQVFADPQVRHLGMATPVEHPTRGRLDLVDQAMRLSRTPSEMRRATPERGEHTDTVLGELGYSEAEIAALRARRVV